MRLGSALSFSLLLAASARAQQLSVVPKVCKELEGDSWHYMPYSNTNQRYMQLIGSEHMPIFGGTALLGFSFRHEGRYLASYEARTLDVEIFMGETTQTAETMSMTFAENYDLSHAPRTSVFKGKINIPAATTGPSTGMGDAIFMHRFSRPYVYEGGNLLIEMITVGHEFTNTINSDRYFGGSDSTTAYGFQGTGCPSGKNRQTITLENVKPGGTLVTQLTDASITKGAALMVLGTSSKVFEGIPLPLDLSAIGGVGCALSTDIAMTVPVTITDSTAQVTLSLPDMKGLGGLVLNTQFIISDCKSNALGLAFSGAAQRVMTENGSHSFNTGYQYWSGSGDPYASDVADSKWVNRGDTMILLHD